MRRQGLDERWLQGAVSCERGDGFLKPWRLPCDRLDLYPSPEGNLVKRAEMPAGVRLRFRTGATRVELCCAPRDVARRFDLTRGAELLQSVELPAGSEAVVFDGLPAGDKVLEVWLPQAVPVEIRDLGVEDGATIEPEPDGRPRWITYGSSISHCGSAHSPARTWPATAARLADLHLTCLGFGGQCHLDGEIARAIHGLPASFISLKVGINIMGASSLSPRTFRPAIIAFVRLLREAHPDIPIAVISPIISPPREATPNAVGFTLSAMRLEVEDAVARMASSGDRNLHYFNGLELFDESLVAGYLPDLLHPNGDGYELMGARFVKRVLGRVGFA